MSARRTRASGSRPFPWHTRDAEPTLPSLNMPLFHTHVVVDWSARSAPSPRRPSPDSIWWAAARDGIAHAPEYARTRNDAVERLAALIAGELNAGRRVLAGFDFPFGYPAGVAERVAGEACALALWDWLDERIADAEDNANNRYDVAERINRAYPGIGPCWGRPRSWPRPALPARASERSCRGAHPPERRIVDRRIAGAKTVWQLAYAGAVGSQALLGIPALKRLASKPLLDGRAAIWPLQTGLRVPRAAAVFAEIYPSLLRPQIRARRLDGEPLDAAQVRVSAEAYARLDAADGLGPLFEGAADLDRDERRLVEAEEAWTLGVGHASALRSALRAGRR